MVFGLGIILFRCAIQSIYYKAISSLVILLSRKISGSTSDGLNDIYALKLKL